MWGLEDSQALRELLDERESDEPKRLISKLLHEVWKEIEDTQDRIGDVDVNGSPDYVAGQVLMRRGMLRGAHKTIELIKAFAEENTDESKTVA